MKMTLLAVAALCVGASAGATPLSTAAAALGANYHAGTRGSSSIYGRCLSYDGGSGYQNNPTGDYTYTSFPVGPGNETFGDTHDYHWVQDLGAQNPNTGTHWSFGALASTTFFLDPSIDHDPLGNESLETTLWGSNDGGATWIRGVLTDVYELGRDANAIVDDGASRWRFSQAVNLISGVWGLTQGSYSYNDGDNEVDAVSIAVPLPTAGLLGVAALGGLGAIRRRR